MQNGQMISFADWFRKVEGCSVALRGGSIFLRGKTTMRFFREGKILDKSMSDWIAAEPDVQSILARYEHPLEALAAGDVPALVLRQAYAPAACERLLQRLFDERLLYDTRDSAGPTPAEYAAQSIPEGYYREGRSGQAADTWQAKTSDGRLRIDIGTSLGYRGSDPEAFFAHSAETHALFGRLFPPDEDPVALCYQQLEQLASGKRVVTAYEPDGRQYGPAIIRAHYGGYTYAPHFDSVRLREKRTDYAVHVFDHQFAGVLVLQNTHLQDVSAQCVLHQCMWQPEVDPYLKQGTFHDYARQQQLANVQVVLEPGDLYFFNTRMIHEVPGVAGDQPRVVLATFIGYSQDRDEIFVWS